MATVVAVCLRKSRRGNVSEDTLRYLYLPRSGVVALRFPDLAGVGARAGNRVPGLSDVEYFAQSLYEPTAFVVPGFPPAMPPVNQPPIGLTDQEILCVIAALQTLGGTPTVTMKTTHKYYDGKPKPGGAAPAAAPAKGSQLRPGEIFQPVAAHAAVISAGGEGGQSRAVARQGEGGGDHR